MKAGGGYVPADMLRQFRVRACADRTRATGDVFGGVSLRERETLARQIFHTRATRGARVSGSSSRPPVGQRAFTLQRLDLFALQRFDLGVQQFVVHGELPTLDFSRAICRRGHRVLSGL